jgi:hypothetical protein
VVTSQEKGCINEFDSKGWGCRHPTVGAKMVVTVDSDYKKRAAEAAALSMELAAALKKGIDFEANKADLIATGKPVLDNAAKLLLKYKDYNLAVKVEGHTDCTKEHNACTLVSLSEDRCATVIKYLKVRFLELPDVSRRNLTALYFVLLCWQAAGCKNDFTSKGYGCKHPVVKSQKLVTITASV